MVKVKKVFSIELPDGKTFDFEASACVTVNNSYGADTEGHRGTRQVSVEDIAIDPKVSKQIQDAVLSALESCEWED